MALPLPLFLLGTRPVRVLVVSASLILSLACAAVVLMTWQVAWILWHHNMSVRAARARRGLDKRTLRSLAGTKYVPGANVKLAECAICLMEFVEGEAIRVLPRCGHGFHAECIDRWLGCCSSCPYCRGGVFQNVSIRL